MKQITAYECEYDKIETVLARAFAWQLVKKSEVWLPDRGSRSKVDFDTALWILENTKIVKELISEYELYLQNTGHDNQ